MPDSLVRVQLQATGADQILATLRAVRQEVALLGQQSARINLAANTTTVNQQLGQITTELARINQMTARARVEVDTSRANGALDALDKKVSSLMTGTVAAIGAIIGTQIAKGFGAAADAIVGFNSTLEQTRIAFTSLLGSAQSANIFIGQLQNFANKTPFDFEAVNRYAQRLIAVGFAAKDVIPDLTAMGNAVAAAGGNADTLDRVTLALGQMHNSVKLNSQDMLQLIQANIPAWKLLADQMGVTEAKARQLAETGKISGADASAAILAGMSQQNIGLMDQLSKTFSGKLENLKDTFRSSMADIGKPLFEELSKAVDLGAKALASPEFKQAAVDMVNDLTAITQAAEALTTALGKIPLQAIEIALRPSATIAAANAITRVVPVVTDPARLGRAELAAPGAIVGALGRFGTPAIDPGRSSDQSAAGDFGSGRTTPLAQPLQGRANQAGSSAVASLLNDVRTGAKTADEARVAFAALNQQYGHLITNVQAVSDAFYTGLNPALQDHINQVNDATAAHEKLQDTLKQAGQAQALGASSEDVGRAIFGITSTGAQATPEQIQRAKQDIQDLTTAYQRAAQVIGTVDLAHGIAGFAAVAPDLAKARDSLRDLGQSNQALDNLASLSAQFKSLSDATDAATTAYRGFMLTLTETDQKIQQLTTFRGQVTGAVSDADRRRSLGIATPEDLQLLANYKNILANIDQQKTGLQRNATGDILGIAANYPDLKKADDTLRDMIGKVGGPQQLVIDVKTNTDKALEQITDLLAKPHQAVIDLTIATHLTGLPPALATIVANAAGAQVGGTPAAIGTVGDSGYARPTTQRLVGGGPYGSGTLYQPGGAIGSAGGGGAGWNQFQPLSQAQYGGIVSSGPLANPQVYAGVMAAAQEYNVDPRALLAFVKNEGVAPSLAAVNNFGGIKGKGGPAAPANEGGTYAAYSSPEDFFRSLAANLTTGAYAGDYQSGNLAAVRQRYVAGSATPSAAQQANIANTVSSYNNMVQQYPSGAGGVITPQVPGSSSLTSRVSLTQPTPIQAGAGQTVTPNQVAAMRKRANELAGSAYVYGGGHSSQDAGGFDCSGYVIEVLRAGGINAPFTDAGGLYKWAQTAEGAKLLDAAGIQLGFYNPGAGGMNEHVGINIGGDWFESGGQRGDTAGPSPNAAQGFNKFVGTPHAVAPVAGGDIALAQTTGAGTSDLTAAATAGGSVAAGIRAGIAGVQGASIGQTLAGLNPQDAQNALAAYQQILPMLREAANLKYPELPVTAENEALQQGLGFLQAWGQAQGDIRTGAAGFADDMQRVTDIIGGPLGAAYGKILQAQYQSARINEQIVSTQSQITQLDTAHQATVNQRTADDRTAGRQQTMQGWADQASDRARQQQQQQQQQANQDAQNAENRRYTDVTRSFQDRQRALQFSQQVGGTDLQNQLTDLQKQQQSTVWQRTSAEQLLGAQVQGAGTNAQAAGLAANLAALHDRDLMQKDADAKAIDDLQEKIRLQQKQANLDSYNLETESIQAQRAHEDRMAQLSDQASAQQQNAQAENDAIQAGRTARDQAHQEELWQVEDTRTSEDAAYQQQKASLAERLTGLQSEKQAQDDLITTLQTMIGLMGQFGDAGTSALSQMVNAASSASSASSGYLNAESKSSYPTGGWIPKLAAGGTVPLGGEAIVGDAGIEHLRVTAQGAVVTPLTGSATGGAGGSVFNMPITINGSISADQIDALTQQFKSALQLAVKGVKNAGANQRRAVGA